MEDRYPGKPKVLFIAIPYSSHTHAWIELMDNKEINVRGFATDGVAPESFDYPVYTCQYGKNFDIDEFISLEHFLDTPCDVQKIQCLLMDLWPLSMKDIFRYILLDSYNRECRGYITSIVLRLKFRLKYGVDCLKIMIFSAIKFKVGLKFLLKSVSFSGVLKLAYIKQGFERSFDLCQSVFGLDVAIKFYTKTFGFFQRKFLAEIIKNWKPDVIHTLGFEPAGYLLHDVKQEYQFEQHGVWVHTSRGGPELALHRLLDEYKDRLSAILTACDKFIADNTLNYTYAKQLGLDDRKIPAFGIVPGTGGIDVERLWSLRTAKPSASRMIVWPKAYECPQSKGLPVLEAIRLCWQDIQPCQIVLTAVVQKEFKMWFATLPDDIQKSCMLMGRIERKALLELIAKARILLAPSLSEGIPNSLYEAMATGAFPIFSPLATFQDLIRDGENGLFARNLYPDEIARAITRAMTDDNLVDRAAEINVQLVSKVANRAKISDQIYTFYCELAEKKVH